MDGGDFFFWGGGGEEIFLFSRRFCFRAGVSKGNHNELFALHLLLSPFFFRRGS